MNSKVPAQNLSTGIRGLNQPYPHERTPLAKAISGSKSFIYTGRPWKIQKIPRKFENSNDAEGNQNQNIILSHISFSSTITTLHGSGLYNTGVIYRVTLHNTEMKGPRTTQFS